MDRQLFQKNRRAFPLEELARYRGQWVAFSSDGCRIIAGADSLGQLMDQLEAMGENLQEVGFESVPGPDDDFYLGAAEFD
jgi:hypothetical protein